QHQFNFLRCSEKATRRDNENSAAVTDISGCQRKSERRSLTHSLTHITSERKRWLADSYGHQELHPTSGSLYFTEPFPAASEAILQL
ncbi:hypothetical protein A2U01_0001507, partial [Trifolium medium]|nr:hypothetical protein [Trifolium medium]